MAYNRSPLPRQSAPSLRNELVLAVGGRAYINLPDPDPRRAGYVPMLGDDPTPNETGLSEGQEVEILAWRPQARHGLSYQVRRLADGRQCWLLSRYLSKTPQVATPA